MGIGREMKWTVITVGVATSLGPECEVLISGGRHDGTYTDSVLAIDPTKSIGNSRPLAPLPTPRAGHTMVTVDSQALVLGGRDKSGYLDEIIAYRNGEWTQVGNLIQRREGHFSLVHQEALVITCGGQYLAELHASCEAFDVKEMDSISFGRLSQARKNAATGLTNGMMHVYGGEVAMGYTSEIELLSIGLNGVEHVELGSLSNILVDGAAIVDNDLFFVFGGFQYQAHAANGPDTWFNSGGESGQLRNGRRKHTATLTSNGKVLIAGGYDSRPHADCELFDLATQESSTFRIANYTSTEDAGATLLCGT